MDREEVLQRFREIGTLEDDIKRRELLTEVQDEVTHIYENVDTLSSDLEKIREENETLRQANMKLFLRVGEQRLTEDTIRENTGLEKEKEPRRFEDLFDEKGRIK